MTSAPSSSLKSLPKKQATIGAEKLVALVELQEMPPSLPTKGKICVR